MKFPNKLHSFFNPENIAVIGASNREESVGSAIMANLLEFGFNGTVYPVNPNRKSVHGVRTYPTVGDIPDRLDLGIIATPADTVSSLVEECGKKGAAGVVIITAGFGETGAEGSRTEEEIVRIAAKYKMRILGPNCLGFIKPSIKLSASFARRMPPAGRIAFISQSGALCTSILDWAIKHNVGFSHFVSIGSMSDIGYHDLIDYFGSDPGTNSIVIYMESLKHARKFMSAARAFARSKPIIILKAGRSQEGAKAALSHTGNLAGNDRVFDAVFGRAGVIRVDTIGELFNIAKTLSMQERPTGNRLAIITNAGGPGVIATDYLIANDGTLAQLSDETIKKLNNTLPPSWSHGNPIDILGDGGPDRYRQTVEILIQDDQVDGILIILTPQAMTHPTEVAKQVAKVARNAQKTILACWMGEDDVNPGREVLEANLIPIFRVPETAVRSFLIMCRYSKSLDLLYETPSTTPSQFKPRTDEARALIRKILEEGRNILNEREAKEFLSFYDIPVLPGGIATSPEEAGDIADSIGYPVVMKVVSPDILHKTDAGGVRLGIRTREDAIKSYSRIVETCSSYCPEAEIRGILVEKMSRKRYELLVGSRKDPSFGPVMVFGMGGVAVEVFQDTSFCIPPLNMSLALHVIEETKIYRLLQGYRNIPGVNIESIQFLLYKFAYLLIDFPEILEIDINPFAVDEKGGTVQDARIILDETTRETEIRPYSHLIIPPYPQQYVRKVKLKDGTEVTLRPIRPEDEPMEAEMFEHFSEETQRFRFFRIIRDITHNDLARFTHIDYDREMAIIAEYSENGKSKMLGVVRIIADYNLQDAEFAIIVVDQWHGKGLGNLFTDYILEIARERKYQTVTASVLRENHIMLHIFKKRGFSVTVEDDVCNVVLELNPGNDSRPDE